MTREQIPVLTGRAGKWIPHLYGKPVGKPSGYRTRREAVSAAKAIRDSDPRVRLECLRGELRAERISYGELVELESLTKFIESGDVELLEAAGVPETADEGDNDERDRNDQGDGRGSTIGPDGT
jgi:hypothetical protein